MFHSLSKEYSYLSLILGIIFILLLWFFIISRKSIPLFGLTFLGFLILFFSIGVALTMLGITTLWKKNKIGIIGLTLSILTALSLTIWMIDFFNIIMIPYEFVPSHGSTLIIPISLGAISILSCIVSLGERYDKNKYSIAGMIICLSSFIVAFILFLIMYLNSFPS